MAGTGRAELARLARARELAERLAQWCQRAGRRSCRPGAGRDAERGGETPELLPPALRGRRNDIHRGLRPAVDGARAIIAAATDPALEGVTGLLLGPDAAPSEELRQFLTPEISASVRALTRRVRWPADR
jgi:hypothetical protein